MCFKKISQSSHLSEDLEEAGEGTIQISWGQGREFQAEETEIGVQTIYLFRLVFRKACSSFKGITTVIASRCFDASFP